MKMEKKLGKALKEFSGATISDKEKIRKQGMAIEALVKDNERMAAELEKAEADNKMLMVAEQTLRALVAMTFDKCGQRTESGMALPIDKEYIKKGQKLKLAIDRLREGTHDRQIRIV